MGWVINAAVAISSFCAAANEGGDAVRDVAGGGLLINQLQSPQRVFVFWLVGKNVRRRMKEWGAEFKRELWT